MSQWQSINFKTYNNLEKAIVSNCLNAFKESNPAFEVTNSSVSVYTSDKDVLYNIENNENCHFNNILNSIADSFRTYDGMDFDGVNCTVYQDDKPVNDVVVDQNGVFETAFYHGDVKSIYETPFKIYDSDPYYRPYFETLIVESSDHNPFAVVNNCDGKMKTAWNEYDPYNKELAHHFYTGSKEEALNVCKMFDIFDVRDRSIEIEKMEINVRERKSENVEPKYVVIEGINRFFSQNFDNENYRVGVSVPRSFSDSGFAHINCKKENITNYGEFLDLRLIDSDVKVDISKKGKSMPVEISISKLADLHEEVRENYKKTIDNVLQKGEAVKKMHEAIQHGLV